DRAATGADVPQALPRQRREASQGDRAHLALGQLPVMLERIVRQAAGPREAPGSGPRAALERDRVEIGGLPLAPALVLLAEHRFAVSAEMLEYREAARSPTEVGQQMRDLAWRRAILRQQQSPALGREMQAQ